MRLYECFNLSQSICKKIGMDKIAHFFGCAFLTLLLLNLGFGILLASSVVLFIGIAKELLDSKFDKKDLLADIFGILISVLCWIAIK